MKGKVGALVLLSLAAMPWFAHAKIFMCVDASGRTISSDRPIPECANRKMSELGNDGLVRREIAAPLTAEQQREKQLQEEKRKAEAAAAREQSRADRAMLARYRSEDDIAQARQRELDNVQEMMVREQAMLAEAENQLQAARAEADKQKKQQSVPPNVRRKLEQAEQAVKDRKNTVHEQEIELEKINARYDQTLRRYRELSGATAAK